ncbi:glycosyltransferase family 4 protein [Streptomonospora salina]|uniref:Phosphatidylinositol alpha 1,6-mannosyltransferase n=1 Tax=Streptomonospora salina TaxID=104205 RepID=A0A841E0K0_9ACTN|nr:glycosyltransferase family 1 protein [Streptomonospora salina]MBB5997277.1 phosphatidylinositol alpha 1,6-mannosyltransferase [Streptomonospora salina]
MLRSSRDEPENRMRPLPSSPRSPAPDPAVGPADLPSPGGDRPLRVAIVTESFLPQVNGVTNSVCRVAEHLRARGHEALILAPGAGPTSYAGFPVVRLPSVPLPVYRSFALGLPAPRLLTAALRAFAPDVVHLASPAVLGGAAVDAARPLALPTVAVYQTDLPGFAGRYGLPGAEALWPMLRRVHAAVDRTLVPSSATRAALAEHGFPRLGLWRRGVDAERFHPRHRDPALRRRLAPQGGVLVGYVGRLSKDKRVDLLAHAARLRGARLVVVGDGPERERLRRRIPSAVFVGQRTGEDLSRLYASLDVFVHTGADETFCQTVQEALASGVPVAAPAAGGPLDLVDPETNGLLYAADSVRELRVALGRMIRNPDLRDRLAAAARPSVEARTWESVGDELLGHYRSVIGPAAASAPRVALRG